MNKVSKLIKKRKVAKAVTLYKESKNTTLNGCGGYGSGGNRR